MIALPALPAAPARVAAPAEPPSDDATADTGGFAAALEHAREPKQPPADGGARCGDPGPDRATPKSARSAEARAKAARDDNEADANAPPDGDGDVADTGTPDLAALLPGWPHGAAPPAAPATPTAVAGQTAQALQGLVGAEAAGTVDAHGGRRSVRPGEAPRAAAPDSEPGAREARLAALATRAGVVPDQPASPAGSVMAAREYTPPAQATKALAEGAATNVALWPAAAAAATGAAASAPNFNASPPAAAAAIHEARVAAPIDSPAFAPALASQVSWLVGEGVQQARLTLNPAEMGPLAVQIVVDGTQARVDFSADLAATRAAIEASLPTLAAALHESGLTLAGGGVSDGQARHGAPDGRQAPQAGTPAHGAAGNGDSLQRPGAPMRHARGLVDLVA